MSRTICIAAAIALLVSASEVSAQLPYPQTSSGTYNVAPTAANWQSYVAQPPVQYQQYQPAPQYQQYQANQQYRPNQGGYRVASGQPTVAPGYGAPANPAPAITAPTYEGYPSSSCGCDDYTGCDPCCPQPACDLCPTPCTRCWYASLGALFLTREAQNSYTFSYDSANEDQQYVNADNADMSFAPGVLGTVGWFDCCSNVGFELTYWQLFPGDQSTQMLGADLAPGFLDGIRNYDQLDYNGGTADANVNAAQIHRLTRSWGVYNVEANRVIVFRQPGCGSPWRFESIAGFRYFKFRESLNFVSDPSDTIIDGDADEYNINIRTNNQLFGFQLGGITERAIGNRWTIRLLGKAGLYANHSTLYYFEGGSAGAAVINNGPNAGQQMLVDTSSNNLAFLGEFGAGATCRLGSCWRLGADYRVIGVTGLALPTDQIYYDTRGINDVRNIDHNAGLLLHGAFLTVERSF